MEIFVSLYHYRNSKNMKIVGGDKSLVLGIEDYKYEDKKGNVDRMNTYSWDIDALSSPYMQQGLGFNAK